MTTRAQILNRMHAGHAEILRGKYPDVRKQTYFMLRKTLSRWGLIDANGITDAGHDVLSAYEKRYFR